MSEKIGKKRSLKKSLVSVILSMAMVISVMPQNAFAATEESKAIVNSGKAIDIIINKDNSYTGSLSDFENNLKAKLTEAGVSARIKSIDNNISLNSFDDWIVYDHYYAPTYSEDGSIPADWNSYSGRHPYYYYKEAYVDMYSITQDQLKAAEAALHNELYTEYSLLIYACQINMGYLKNYYAYKKPYSSLSDAEKSAIEPYLLKEYISNTGISGSSLAEVIEKEKDMIAKNSYQVEDYDNLTPVQKAEVDTSVSGTIDYCYQNVAFTALDDNSKRAVADELIGTLITDYGSMTPDQQVVALTNYKNTWCDTTFSSYLQSGESFTTLDEAKKATIISQYYYSDYINRGDINNKLYYYAASTNYYTDLSGMNAIHYRDKHIYTSIAGDGSTSMTFLGYSSPAFKDFKLYPTSQEIQKTVDFDIDASKVFTHTLQGAGFLINSGIDNSGYIHGYIMFYQFDSNESGNVILYKINDNITANDLHQSAYGYGIENYCTQIGLVPFALDNISKKKHVKLIITPTTFTAKDTDYTDTAGTTLSSTVNTLFEGTALDSTGYNGYGPIVSYAYHGCEMISAFTFSGLNMKFMSIPVDSLRNATYRSDSNVSRIFINLTGNAEKAIADMTTDETATYYEMQTRLVQDQIFYLSTGGHTIVDSIGGNGLDLSISSDTVTDAFSYIKSIANGTTKWGDVSLSSLDASSLISDELLPTAIFDVLENNTGNTVLTVNRNIIGEGITLSFGNLNKSISRASDTAGGSLSYIYKVFDPSGNEMSLSENHELVISQYSALGDYTFSLTVTDSQGRTSKMGTRTVQLMATAMIPAAPAVTADNSNRILLGADATMEYSTDGGANWIDYNPSSAPTFAGTVTVIVRVKATSTNSAGDITTVNFTSNTVTSNPIPVITAPSPYVEKILVDVKIGETDTTAAQISNDRTTIIDGKKSDNIIVDTDKANEILKKLKDSGVNLARFDIKDTMSEVENTTVTLLKESLSILAKGEVGVRIDTEEAKLEIPTGSLQFADNGVKDNLYFRILPVKQEEKTNISNRAVLAASSISNDKNHSVQLEGVPMTIDTNMPSTAVDIVLPLRGIALPEDQSERKAFLDQLAIYFEHSDGTKEFVQGKIIEYTTGLLGIKVNTNKFGTFAIVKTDLFPKSSENSIMNIMVPTAATISGKDITAKVDNATATLSPDIQVSEKASWKLYMDKECTNEIKNNLISLAVGKNIVYLKIIAEDGSYQIYTLTITRAKAEPIKVEKGFGPLRLKAKVGATTQKLSFTNIPGADGYILYAAPCNPANKMVKIATLAADANSYEVTGLKKDVYYKFQVKAYKLIKGKKIIIAVSKVIHSTTTSKKYTNPTKVTSSVATVSLKAGETMTLKCEVVSLKSKTVAAHIEQIRYESTNTAISTVDSKGKITAKTIGTCYVYAYAQNGVYTKIKVTVE